MILQKRIPQITEVNISIQTKWYFIKITILLPIL